MRSVFFLLLLLCSSVTFSKEICSFNEEPLFDLPDDIEKVCFFQSEKTKKRKVETHRFNGEVEKYNVLFIQQRPEFNNKYLIMTVAPNKESYSFIAHGNFENQGEHFNIYSLSGEEGYGAGPDHFIVHFSKFKNRK